MTLINATIVDSSNEQENILHRCGLPKPILYYLKKNSNPRLLFKLMKISKYFQFKEFPFFVVKNLEYAGEDQWIYQNGEEKLFKKFDLQTLSKSLWITNEINIFASNKKGISQLLSKTAVCDIKKMDFFNQILSMDEFKFLVSSNKIENPMFYHSHVEKDDGSIVPIDEVIKCLPNVKQFGWYMDSIMASTVTHQTAKKLIKVLNPSILTKITLISIPDTFDFCVFADFMEKNPSIDYYISFQHTISIEYSNMLQNYVDNIIETDPTNKRQIMIHFLQQTVESFNLLLSRYCSSF
uniref:Uncharacterized protein n=1 Tax=Panagrolaimus sp. ES5 TaxID=591445 RepID=A0AC34F6W5_9BILA